MTDAQHPEGGLPADVVELAPGRLYALTNPYRLDGRVSSHPPGDRGFAPMNCYLAVEGDRATLIDTGLTVHEDRVLAQLEALLPANAKLTIWSPRIGEFNAICNVRPIAERFDVEALYGIHDGPERWVEFRPEHGHPGDRDVGVSEIPARVIRTDDVVHVDAAGERRLLALPAPLRLLPTVWILDEATRTLFTADAFTWGLRPTSDGPWTITADDDPVVVDDVERHLVRNRYWWLPGSRTEGLRRECADAIDRHGVEVIAPGFGCLLVGRAAVERHRDLLDDVLAAAAGEPSVGIEAGRWRVREAA